MPYTIHKKNGKYCVIKKSTGEAIPGTSDSRDRALARIRAINIHEHESVHHEMGDDEDREFYESLDAEHRQMYDSLMEQAAAHRLNKGTHYKRIQNIRDRASEIGYKVAKRQMAAYPHANDPSKVMKHWQDRKQSIDQRVKPLIQNHL